MHMVKLLSLRLNQCFGSFTILPIEGSSEPGLFRHLSNHIFWTPSFPKYISYGDHLFWKCSKFDVDLKNAQKNSQKPFCFSDKCIWIFSLKLALLRREHMSLAVNLLTKGLKGLHVINRNSFQLKNLHIDQWIW